MKLQKHVFDDGKGKEQPVAPPVRRAGSFEIIFRGSFHVLEQQATGSGGMMWMDVPKQNGWRKGLSREGLSVKGVFDP